MRSKFKWIFTLLLAFTMQFSFAQEKTVTGVVSDKTGPLPGANVVVKGSNRSAQADFDGKYSIKAKAGEVLVISFTGYNNSSVTVGTASTYNVTLNDGIKLDEVVVEGYRSTTKATTVVAQTTVNAKTIENRPNASFIQTLQGQVAGLNIMTGTGQPGSKSTVLLRGVGTINANTDPLYVIDGMPTNGDNFRSLNPNDIESATVLKDASATAVYGNRAANGVIVIKTRRGGTEDGKTKFRYSLNTGFSELQSAKYAVSNSHEMLKLEQIYGVGRGATLSDAEIDAYPINTNWNKYFFRTGVSKEHNFSVESQGKQLNSYTSVSYLDQEGVLKGTKLNRFTFRNNIDGKSKDEKFRYSTNLSIGFSKNNEAGNLGTGAVNRNYVLGAYTGAPYVSPDEYTGSQALLDLYGSDGTLLYTPLFLIDKMKTFTNNTDETRVLGSIEASYEIFKNANFTSRTSSELLENRFTQSEHPISFNALLFVNPAAEFGGFEDVNNRRDFSFSQLWQFDYAKTFSEKHNLRVLLATEYNLNQLNASNSRQRGLNPLTFVPGTGSGYLADITAHDFYGSTSSVSMIKKNMISYFTTVDYDYDKKFGLVGSLRYDGSSRFIGKRQWGTFWSLGGRWNLNNMSFMKENNLFQVLKLRASIGTTGNERLVDGTIYAGINPPAFTDTYTTASNVYNGIGGYAVSLGYQDLHWETTKQADIGLDFELMKNRLRGTFDWYNRVTMNIFDQSPISPITGQTQLIRNTQADVTNTGVELALAYDVVRNENFKFTIRANGSYNDNTVNGIVLNDGQIIDGNFSTSNGHQVGEYYVTHYAGVNPLNGELLFEEGDGTLTETPSAAALKYTRKSQIPVYQGGFGFDLDYKGFFATTNFTYAQKVWRFDFDMSGLYDPTNLGQFNVTSDLFNAWTPTNTNTNVPSLNALNSGTADNSDRFLNDASYIRLRFLQVGYRVPKKFLEKTFMTNLSFYAQGENLHTWTKWQGFDAESNRAGDQYQYPTPKIISFGMDLRF